MSWQVDLPRYPRQGRRPSLRSSYPPMEGMTFLSKRLAIPSPRFQKPPSRHRVNIQCKFYLVGNCKYGDQCRFLHAKPMNNKQSKSKLSLRWNLKKQTTCFVYYTYNGYKLKDRDGFKDISYSSKDGLLFQDNHNESFALHQLERMYPPSHILQVKGMGFHMVKKQFERRLQVCEFLSEMTPLPDDLIKMIVDEYVEMISRVTLSISIGGN